MKARPKSNSLWILSSRKDLALFVLAPVWVIPLLWMAKGRFDPNGFGSVLLAVGATGHHLPGFIRAYTDPVLFRRFRTRFILAPLFFLGVYVLFFGLHLESLKLILILWGVWHGAMQVNGFLRIYDAKAGSFSSTTSWLDWAMCIVWFGGGLLYSSRIIAVFSHFFNAGGRPISPAAFASFRYAWMALLAVVTLAFLLNVWKQTRAGAAPSPVKLLMMASSFALWWFAMVSVSSVLVGVLLFETTVLGVSEYRKIETPLLDQARNLAQLLPDRWQANAVAGSLESANGNKSRAIEHLQRSVALNPSYAYGETMLGDIYADRRESELALQHYFRAAALNPGNYDVQDRLGRMLVSEGRLAEAIPHLQIAAEYRQTDARLAYVLGVSLVREKRASEGIPYLRRAVRLNPQQKEAFNYLAVALQIQGSLKEAADYYRKTLELDPQFTPARENLERLERFLVTSERGAKAVPDQRGLLPVTGP